MHARIDARISALVLAFALAFTGLASAQERFGGLTGKVTDQQGSAVPGVTVVLTSTETGATREFVTDTNGQYTASDLAPGRYAISFELSGFSKVERADILVQLGRIFDVDAQLTVGAVTETVQVTGEVTPLIDTRSTLVALHVEPRHPQDVRSVDSVEQRVEPSRRAPLGCHEKLLLKPANFLSELSLLRVVGRISRHALIRRLQ